MSRGRQLERVGRKWRHASQKLQYHYPLDGTPCWTGVSTWHRMTVFRMCANNYAFQDKVKQVVKTAKTNEQKIIDQKSTVSGPMQLLHKNVLKNNLSFLAEDIDPTKLLTLLMQKGIFTEIHTEQIKRVWYLKIQYSYTVCSLCSRENFQEELGHERNVKLIKLLKQRGPSAFDAFIESLSESSQDHIAKKLLEDLQKGSGNIYILIVNKLVLLLNEL